MNVRYPVKCLFSLFLLFNGLLVIAGNPQDTVKPAVRDTFRVSYFIGEFYKKATRKEKYELTGFQQYDPPGYLGNIGQARIDYLADQPVQHTGLSYFKNDFAHDLVFADSIKYYDAHTPYTRLFFLAGQAKEAQFNFTHSQNINKNLNVTAFFNRIRSDGTYLRQATNMTSMYLSSNYKSPGKRYYLVANIIYNIDKPQVNGGIKGDSIFLSGQPNKKVVPVNLMAAQRRYRNRSVSLHQFFNMGITNPVIDSSRKAEITPTSAFSLNSSFSDQYITYSDLMPDSGFYYNRYQSATLTHDSVYFFQIKNSIGWNTWDQNKSGKHRLIGAFASIENELSHVHQYGTDTLLVNWIARGGLRSVNDSVAGILFRINAEYGLAGYNKGDYRVEVFAEKPLGSKGLHLGVQGISSLQHADFMAMQYSSNNFVWHNSFEQQQTISGKLYLKSDFYRFEVGIFGRGYNHLIYYQGDATPAQLATGVSLLGGYARKDLRLGHWNFNNKVTWQYPSDAGILQFPEWVTQTSLFFQNNYKNKMTYQVGADLNYFSSYFANNYMPATGQFYVQTEKKTGNYPFLDFFVSMQIRTVRVFIKYEHLNSGYPSNRYYFAPGYPAPDSWIFNN
jgi:hypothetical protein